MLRTLSVVLGILLIFGCADVSKESQLQTGCSGGAESTPENEYVSPAPTPTPTAAPYPTTMYSGDTHTCALLSNKTIECWGNNSNGQLGDGSTTNRMTPVTVSGISNATAIGGGEYYSCALLSNSTVQCWGFLL